MTHNYYLNTVKYKTNYSGKKFEYENKISRARKMQ